MDYAEESGKKHVITTSIEHKAVLETAKSLKKYGFDVDIVDPETDGRINVEKVSSLLKEDTLLVSVMHANNETGVIQPVKELGELLADKGILFHIDATQSCGKLVPELREMAGWNLKSGSITEYDVSEDRIWSLFNYVFSNSSRKRNTYKFGLVKSLLDNVFNGQQKSDGIYFTYEELFGRFAENYWNLVIKYDLRQMRPDGKSMYSKVESILKQAAAENQILVNLEFEAIEEKKKQQIIKKVATECKKCVVGALYDDFDGVIYSFDLKESGLILNYCIYDFMLRHKSELEKLNYYSWARFLEQVNDDNALIRVINKLELATPKREDLSVYREILRREFEEDTCFYCGKKLQKVIHVDHFIPWSFVKDDKIWNFVLSCPTCNEKKNNRVPGKDYLIRIEDRNKKIQLLNNTVIQTDFAGYSDDLIGRMWSYAKLSGIKEYRG